MEALFIQKLQVLYKMKYWQGVNFGDWRLLDKTPTFNPIIIIITCIIHDCMCHPLHQVTIAKW